MELVLPWNSRREMILAPHDHGLLITTFHAIEGLPCSPWHHVTPFTVTLSLVGVGCRVESGDALARPVIFGLIATIAYFKRKYRARVTPAVAVAV